MTPGKFNKDSGNEYKNRWRRFFAGRKKWILLIVLAALIGLRAALPYIVKSYVNKTLAVMPGYPGHVDDVDLSLWRGAYVIQDLKIEKVEGNIPVPFFSAKLIDLSVEWTALFHGSLVGEIEFINPKISFVQGPTEKESQNGKGANFIETIKKLFPVRINRFDVQNGEVHFRNFHTDPKVDIHLDSLFLHAKNLTNSERLSKVLPASIDAKGKAMHTGRLKGHLDIDPYAQKLAFNLDLQLEQVELTTLNSFFDGYASVDVKSGVFEMYTEVAAADGKFTGYVKPLFKDMRILDLKKDAKKPLKLLWEAVVEALTQLFTNHSTGQLGTKIPLSGSFDNPKEDILSTIGGILKNAFITALQPGIEGTVTLKKAQSQ
jgi:Domain of Unknown Function (DUF748)